MLSCVLLNPSLHEVRYAYDITLHKAYNARGLRQYGIIAVLLPVSHCALQVQEIELLAKHNILLKKAKSQGACMIFLKDGQRRE